MDKKAELFKKLEEIDDAIFNSNASDGAWFTALEYAVRDFNRDNGTKFDENVSVHEYLQVQETWEAV